VASLATVRYIISAVLVLSCGKDTQAYADERFTPATVVDASNKDGGTRRQSQYMFVS